ncbi:MAG: hypothetical protein HC862_24295 [Scytonema sp. RU_4_4]|nr:hypothetical protein [Scytonema sp. RU_4_4]
MRFYFYAISGMVSALIAWSFSQIFLIDLREFFSSKSLPFNPDLILLPIVAASLVVAMVVTEIFLSNPTRYKANRRVLPPYLWAALGMGAVAGLVASALTGVLYQTGVPAWSVRIISWSLIGFFTGLGEGVSWRLRSVEGKTRKAMQRLRKGALYGLEAGFLAAVGVEILRGVLELGGYEDPLGFLILGLALGLSLGFATSPTYQVALRAGEGFEAIDPSYDDTERIRPYLKNPDLRFVTLDDYKFIEEGLSIQLPAITKRQIKKQILVGSSLDADIVIPDLPLEAASLEVNERNVTLSCLTEGAVQLQSKRLAVGGKLVTLRHNQILTLFHALDEDKYYRFVFYDRFLDPEA